MRCSSVLILLITLQTTVSQAATITVCRDGSGDFSILHQALAAVADGDTILVGPGEFTETQSIRPAGWTYDLEVYGQISVPHLTIIGAGAGTTIIGPVVAAPFTGAETPDGLVTNGQRENVSILDVTIRNCYIGLSLNCSLQLERCNIDNNRFGLSWTARGAGGVVRDCVFSTVDALEPLGLYVRGVAGIVVENCQFTRARPLVDNLAAVFRRCDVEGPDIIGFYSASGTCQIWDCSVTNVDIGLTTGYEGSRCEIHDSQIAGSFYALRADARTTVLVEGTSLSGGTDCVIRLRESDAVTVHGCDLMRGTGPVVVCSRPASFGGVVHDFSGNYWGTTDEAQIRDWIIDNSDDASIHATVLYSPFAGQSVPTESTTWGDLKSSFR